MSYMNPSTRHSVSEVRQRSQSTPNVTIRPAQRQLQRPRRTKTNIDFLAVPPRDAIHGEKRVDPFNLGGFFPSSPRQSDQEPCGWWREEGPEEGPEFTRESVMVDNESGLLGSQRVLFGREDQPAEAVIKREDKLGVLTVCTHFPFHTRSSSVIRLLETVTGGRPNWVDEEERLHSPYISDEACDDEALRLAYERRRQQLVDGGDGELPEKTSSLFYEGEEEEEAAGWFGLMMMRI